MNDKDENKEKETDLNKLAFNIVKEATKDPIKPENSKKKDTNKSDC